MLFYLLRFTSAARTHSSIIRNIPILYLSTSTTSILQSTLLHVKVLHSKSDLSKSSLWKNYQQNDTECIKSSHCAPKMVPVSVLRLDMFFD